MKDSDVLAAIASDLNNVPASAARAGRHAAMVSEVNAVVRAAADSVLGFDVTPMSFPAFKAEQAGGQ